MATNLISKVDGVTLKYTPSEFTYGLQDVSDTQAGRTLDALMHKNRIAQKRKLNLSWNVLHPEEISELFQMFDPEYVEVTYWDAKDGREETRTFYTGDKSAPVYSWAVGTKFYTKVTFNIIER